MGVFDVFLWFKKQKGGQKITLHNPNGAGAIKRFGGLSFRPRLMASWPHALCLMPYVEGDLRVNMVFSK